MTQLTIINVKFLNRRNKKQRALIHVQICVLQDKD